MNTIVVKTNNTTETVSQIEVVTKDGIPTVIQASERVNYEFHDNAINRAPNHIITKRIKNDLHVSFEKKGEESDLIIEGFYDSADSALLGIAEDGEYYYYIPDTGETYDYVTQLEVGDVEGQALGGEVYAAVIPWWIPAAAGLGIAGLLASTSSNSRDDTLIEDNTPPLVENEVIAGSLGQSVTITLLSSAIDLEGDIDPTSVKLINPNTGLEVTSLTVPGEGTWSVNPETGAVTFTPEAGFTADPTPVAYIVSDLTGNKSNQATITVDYPPTAPNVEDEIQTGSVGQPVVINVLDNATDLEGDIDPTSVKLINPNTGLEVTSLTVPGEGTWSVNPETGAVTFTPEAGFTADPTPVAYIVSDLTGNKSNQATITVDYPPTAPNVEDEIQTGSVGQPVVINVLDNATDLEGDIDPTSVKLINPNTGLEVTSLTVPGEGTWSVNPETGAVTFTPEAGFTADPTPVAYIVSDLTGNKSNQATITVDYPPTAPNVEDEIQTGSVGQPVVINVLDNATDLEGDIDPTTVKLIDPDNGDEVTTLTVTGEGEWVVDPTSGAVTFTPEVGYTGDPTPVDYIVVDSTNLKSDPATITIDYPQTAPVAQNDADTGDSGETVVVDVVANDTDAEEDLDPTTVIITQSPAGGTIAADGKSVVVDGEGSWNVDADTGAISFTPEAGFTADPTPISYSVEDINGLVSNEATVTIDYPQTAPVAQNDADTGDSGETVVVDVVANDTDAEEDLDPTTVIITQSPAGGTIAADGKSVVVDGEGSWSVDADTGAISFTPEDGFTADPTPISYSVEDINGLVSNEATVTIDYPQTAPVAQNDVGVGPLNTPVTVDILNNDSDAEGDLDPTTVKLIDPDNGDEVTTLTVTGEGEWVVDPTSGAVTFTPEVGFTNDPTPVDYVVSDITGQTSNPATIVVDYPPTAPRAADDNQTGITGEPVTVAVLGNDEDFDNDIDPTTVKLIDPDNGDEVTTLTVTGEGEWVVDPTSGAVTFTPEDGYTGDPTPVDYIVVDSTNLKSDPATITIDYPQTAPVAQNDADTGDSGETVVVDVVANDTDAEEDLDPTTVIITQSPAGGTIAADGKSVVVDGEGSWSVDADTGAISFTPEDGFTADPTPISYSVEDINGLVSNEATVTIDYPQTAPVAQNDADTGDSGETVVVDVVANDTDAEEDLDPTTVIITQSPAGGTIAADGKSVVVDGEGSWNVDADTGAISFTPEDGFTADPTPISYSVEDINGLVSNEATVTIDYPQTAPVAQNDVGVGPLNTPVTVDILNNDSDAEGDLDPTTVKLIDPDNGDEVTTLTVTGEGEWVVDPTSGAVTFTPEVGFTNDPTPVDYVVSDITGQTSNPATIVVDYPPTAPRAADDNQTGITGEPVTVAVLGNDEDFDNDIDPTTVKLIDPDNGDEVTTLTVTGEGEWVVDPTSGAVTFTPEDGYTGDPTPVDYIVVDSTNLKSDPATITIDYPQTAPVAQNDADTGDSGETVVVDVVANDTDAEEDLDPTTVIITQSPAGGTIAADGKSVVVDGEGSWSVDADTGAISFTPEDGFTADPTPISYSVEDINGLVSNEATVTIDYPQTAPVAQNDADTGDSGETVVVDVVANDTDAEEDLDPTTVIITQSPAGGTIAADGKSVVVDGEGSWSVDADTGAISFTPEDGFTADPTPISYSVEDINGLVSNEATVTIDYPQTAPVAQNDADTGDSGETVVVDVVANDTDAEEDLDPTTVIITQSPAGGTIAADGKSVVVDGEGSWSVDADTGAISFTPEDGFTADPTPISYSVEDINGLVSNEATVTIDYPQTAPVAQNDVGVGPLNTPVTVDILNNDSDAEGDLDPTTVKLIDPDNGDEVTTLTVTGEGEWVVDPTSGAVTFTPEVGFTNDPTPVDYVVSDITGQTSNPATIVVDYPPTAPRAADDNQTGITGEPVTVAVLGNDEDFDNDIDPTTVKLIDPDNGDEVTTLTVTGEGEWVVDPTSGAVTFTPEDGYTGDPTPVDYIVVDSTNLKSDPATITIDYPQTAPVAQNDADTGDSGETVVVDVVANDTDAEEDLDPTTVIITQSPAGGTIAADGKSVVVDGEGSWSVDADTGAISFTPEDGFTADPTPISYSVEDINGLVSNEATVTIDYPQTAPVAQNDADTGDSGETVVVDVVANDTDAEEDLDPTTVIITQSPAGGTIAADGKSVVVDGEGSWSVDADTGAISFTPEDGFTADPTPISYSVEDINGLVSNEATVTIDYPQTAPVAQNDADTGDSGETVVVDVVANDTDAEEDLDPTTVIITQSPAGGTIAADGKSVVVDGEGSWSVDADTGAISFTPEDGFTADPTPISYSVEDINGLVSNEATVTIDYPQTAPVAQNDVGVGPLNTPVTVDILNNDSDAEGDLDPTTVKLIDPDNGDEVTTLTVTGEGEWVVDPTSGAVTFTPEVGFTNDPTPVDYVVSDITGQTSNPATIVVDYPPTAPRAADDNQTGITGEPVTVAVLGNDEDFDNDIDPTTVKLIDPDNGDEVTTLTVTGEGEWVVDPTSGAVTFTPEDGYTGDPTPVDYIVVDSTNLKSDPATITIDYPQTAPVAQNDADTGDSGETVVVDVVANDTDAEEDLDPTTVIITQSPAGGTIAADGKSVVVDGEGSWSVDADTGAISFTPEDGFTADPTPISYSVEDINGLVSNEATVTIDYPQTAPVAQNDADTGDSGETVVVDVVANDTDAEEDLDPTTVIITQSPAGGTIAADGKSVVVDGEGSWNVDADTGAISFTPEDGFTADPTPISYSVEDINGLVSNEATVTIDYPQTAPVAQNDADTGDSGETVVVDVVANDTDAEEDLDPTTVIITQSPAGGTIAADGKSVVVDGEGSWSVDADTGAISFTPEDGFTADPTPISYSVEDINGLVSNEATVTIDYPQTAPVAQNDVGVGPLNTPVTVDILNNDSDAEGDLDPTTVKLIDPDNGDEVTTLTVTGEGEWVVDPTSGAVTFTPEVGFTNDPTPVDYVVSDITGQTSNPATIVVDYPPTAPRAADDNQTGITGEPVTVAVLGNDEDFDNDIDPTTVKLIDPDNGDEVTTLTVTGEGEWVVDPTSGAVTFTPEDGYTGDPTPVDYIVVDSTNLKSDPATITIDYPQTAPVAQNDADTGDSGETVVVDVVANDTDAEEDLDPTTVIITQSPAGGTIAADGKSVVVDGEGSWSVDADTGAISFTPEDGFTADPTPISYSVEDINGLVSNEATVTIDYPQTAPVAQNDADTGDSGETVVVDVVANDTDAEEDLDPTTVIITQSPAGGTIAADGKSVVVDGEGSWSVDADTGAISFTPEDGFTADPTPISYSVEDINGLVSNEATVTIDYPQTAPVAQNDADTGDSGETVVVDVVANDTDAEEDLDPTTVIITQSPAGGTIAADGKSVVVDGEGSWSVDADTGAISFTPEDGFTADPTPISYSVEDINGLVSNEATVTIDYPQTAPVAQNDADTGDSGETVVVDVVANDTDAEEDLDPTTVIITQSPAGGTIAADGKSVVVDGEGSWSVDADTGAISFTPEDGFTADPTPISYSVEDINGLVSNEATVTIDYPQTAPVAQNDADTGDSGETVVVDVVANDTDAEEDLDPTTVIITQSPAGGTIAADGKSVVVDGEGSWSVDADTGAISFTPEDGFTADPTPISYSVEDINGLVSNEATVTIDYPQTAPVAQNDADTGDSGETVVVDVVANDTDAEEDLDPTTVIITQSPAGGTIAADGKSVVVDGEGSWSVDADTGAISFTPEDGFTADPTPISYSVEDINGLVSNEATVTIDYPQTAPVAQNDADTGVSGETVVVDVVANDTDAEEDLDPTTVIITQSPAGGTIAADGKSVVVDGEGSWNVDADTGAISFTPEDGFTADPTPISYSVEDINGLVSNEATVTIDYPQTAPVAQNDADTGDSGETVVVDVVANDTDAEEDLDPTTVIITQSPAGGTIAADGKSVVVDGEGSWSVDADTGAISFTPEDGFTADPTPISYSVEDINGLVSNEATVTIDYPQTAPVAQNDADTGDSGETVVVDVVANDTDAEEDLDPTTVIITQSPAGGTIAADGKSVVVDGEGSWSVDADTGAISFTPEDGFTADPTPISYSVEDINGLVSNEATVTIDYPQTAPVAQNDADTGDSGETVVVDVVANDTDAEEDLDPTTVIITQSPAGGTIAADGKSVVVDGEGSWSVDADTGAISFTPEDGFTADPTPISYSVEDINGLVSNEATVTIDYPQTAPVAVDDQKLNQPFGDPITVAVVANDTDVENDLDPTTVKLIDPDGNAEVTTLTVTGEGEWVVDPTSGAVTFTPENGYTGDPTPVDYVVSDRTGLKSDSATITVDYDQLTRVEVALPGRVSEEGLEGGNPDSDPNSTLDTTDSASDTVDNWIRVTDTDTDLADAVVGFTLPTTGNNIMSQGNPVIFRIDSATGNIIGEYEYIDSNNITQIQNVLTISLNGNKEVITDGYQFGYDVTLGAPVDHTQDDNVEGILSVNFGVEVFENASAIESLVQSDELLAIIEDDSPAPQPVVWNIDVQQETITISGLQTGFTETLFTQPTNTDNQNYLVANNPAANNPGTTVPSRDYGTTGVLSAEQDATYTAPDGNPYIDSLDEGIYWGRPVDANSSPAGYTTYENTTYQGAGEEIKFETNLDLGDFSHINFGVFGDGGVLLETTLNIDFTMDVNGNSETVNVDYLLKHNETPNNFTTATFGLDTDTYSDVFVQSDFIVIPNASKIIDIAGQQYQLDITLANQDTGSTIDSDKNKDFLKIYQGYDGIDNDGDGRVDESLYSAIGKLFSTNAFVNQVSNGTNYYDLNGNGILGDKGDAQFVANLATGFRYTILGNGDIAYIDSNKNGGSDGIDFDGDNINDAVDINGDGRLDYIVYSTTGQRAEDTDGDGVIDRVDTNNDGIVDTDLVLDGSDYNPALDDAGTFVVNSEEGQENTYDVIGKLTPLNPLPKLSNNIVVEGKVAVGADTVNYLNSTGTGIVWSGVSTTDSDGTITTINTDSDATNYEFQTDYGVFIGYADGSYTFNAADNIADIVNPNADDIDVFSFEYQDSDGDTASSTVTLNYNEYAAPQSPDSINSIPSRTTADNDYLVGTNQAEVIEGGDGDDTLIGLSGIDSLFGGSGSDTVVFDRNDLVVDGGEGESSANIQDNDTLLVNDLNVVASNDMTQVVNFETIDMTNDTAQTLSLGLSDVVSITDNNNELFIKGDSTDTVNISDMTKSATSDQVGYDLYQDGANSAKLYVQTAIDDNVI